MLFTPCCQSQCIQTNGLEKCRVFQEGHNLVFFQVSESYSKAIKNGSLIEVERKMLKIGLKGWAREWTSL